MQSIKYQTSIVKKDIETLATRLEDIIMENLILDFMAARMDDLQKDE
jgi:hypothetical protein